MTQEELEEKRLDEFDNLFPELIKLKQQENLLLGFPVTKYDSVKAKVFKLYPDGKKKYL